MMPLKTPIIVLFVFMALAVLSLYRSSLSTPAYHTDREHAQPSARPQTDRKWVQPILPDRLLYKNQSDPELIKHISHEWIIPPSHLPRRLKNPNLYHYSQARQSLRVDKILHGKNNGFYVECGAADGEKFSNSLFFEKHRNWSGVLIEGYIPWFHELLELNRKAYSVGACLSGVKKPVRTRFSNIGYGGGLIDFMGLSHLKRFGGAAKMEESTTQMQCLPLYSILRAMGVSHVDYFSLDIEGAELEVIKTLPLDEITVDVFTIEYVVGDTPKNKESQQKLRDIKDYLVGEHSYEMDRFSPWDDVFLKRKGV